MGLKKPIVKVRDNLHRDLYRRLEQLERALEETIDMQKTLAEEVQKVNSRIKNSGVINTGEHEILVKIFNGLKMYLDTRDIGVAPHLALDGIWEPEITKAWLSVVRSNDTVLDIGANFGYFGLLAAQKVGKKDSRIIFFEANPELTPFIKKTLAMNWYVEQSVVENLAVSNSADSTLTLNVLKDYVASSSVHTVEELGSYLGNKAELELERSVRVPSITIDEYCKKAKIDEVDVIKIDIEGYEDKAYEGMRKTVQASSRLTLFIEFTKDGYSDPKGFYEQLMKDFGNVYLINADGELVRPKDPSYENIIESSDDWVMPVFSKNNNLLRELSRD